MSMIKHAFSFLLLLSLTACGVTPVATKHPQVEFLLVQNKVSIDIHWQQLLTQDAEARSYAQFAPQYQSILPRLKMLLELNKMRDHNEDSIEQSENLMALWLRDMKYHEEKNTISDFVIKRRTQQYQRMFDAMLLAENAKLEAKE